MLNDSSKNHQIKQFLRFGQIKRHRLFQFTCSFWAKKKVNKKQKRCDLSDHDCISKFLMLYNVSIKATSPSTVSNRPISYSVTFWGSNEEVELYKKWLKIEVLQMIFHNLKSILTSRNLAAGYNLTSSPSYKDFKKCASINVTLYGFGIIQGFSAKKLFLWPNQLYLSGFM